MEKVTFPDPRVRSFLAEHFRGVRFDLATPHPDFKEATATAKIVWAPTVIVLDPRGREWRRSTGWLPPEEWIADLMLPIALDRLQHRRFDDSARLLARVVEETPDAPAAAEALHWLGIVEFLAGNRDMAKLAARWNEVRRRYPGTRFARHSEVIDDASA